MFSSFRHFSSVNVGFICFGSTDVQNNTMVRYELLEDWKIKVSVLWLFPLLGFLASMVLMLTEPGMLEEGTLQGIQMTAEVLLVGATIDVLVPLVMAFLSLTLKDSINRRLNMLVGGIYAVFEFITLVEKSAAAKGYVLLMLIAAIVALILIVWFAWKSKQKA